MRTKKWIQVSDREPFRATKMSGGENTQLGGYDARNRVIAQPNGVNRTPDIISRPGKHVPQEKPWVRTPDDFCKPMPYSNSPDPMNYPKGKAAKGKVAKTMHEWGQGTLHSGSKKGPVVKSQKQAVAIALNQARNKS